MEKQIKIDKKQLDKILTDANNKILELESKINKIKTLSNCIDFTTKESFKQDITTLIKVINDL